MSDMGILLVLVILGLTLFFLAPKFLNSKGENEKATPLLKKAEKPKEPIPYVAAYQKGTSKAREAQNAANERNSAY